MTPDQLTELAQRLLNHAAMHDSVVPYDDEQRQWRDDLIAAAEYLRQCAQADVANDSNWLGPFATATEALNELRMSVATMMGADPNTWPDHGNAPLAIAAAFGIRQHALDRARDVLAAQGGNDE